MQGEEEVCVIPLTKWNSITNWLTQKQPEEEKKERHNIYLKHLKQMSSELVAGKGSMKEAAAKRLEEKSRRSDGDDKKILNYYLRIKENQRIERDRMVKKYQRQNLINKTPTLELTSALKEAETQGERQKQIELKQALRMKEKEMEAKEHYELKCQWQLTNVLHRKEEDKRKCELDAIKSEVWKQCQNNSMKKQEEYRNRVKQERLDLYKIAEELRIKENNKRAQQLKEKKRTSYLMKNAIKEAEKQRFIKEQQDQELYRVNQIINNALTMRNCHIERKLKEERKERVLQNEDLYTKYVSQIPPKEPSEETVHQNGILENQEEYEKKMQEKRALEKKHAEAKIQNYKEDMRRQKLKQEEEAELRRLEMIERFKKIEAMKHLDEISKEDEHKKKKNYGQELLRQAEEQKNIKKHEKKLEDEYVFYTHSKEDDRFVEYAEEVIKLAKEKKWTTLPIRKAIENYKKSHHIMQRQRKVAPCGEQSDLLKYEEECIYRSTKEQKKFVHLESLLKS